MTCSRSRQDSVGEGIHGVASRISDERMQREFCRIQLRLTEQTTQQEN